MRALLSSLAVAMAGVITLSAAHADIKLTFAVDASDKPSAMVAQLRPTLDLVQRGASTQLGERVEISMRVLRDYEDGLSVLLNGTADFARLGPASYIQAKQRSPTIEILAVEELRGKKQFDGVICVATASIFQSVEDLRGHSFAFGAEDSTIGRYLAQLYLLKNGIKAKDLKSYAYLDRHDRVGEAVASGLFDGGALEETVFKQLVDGGAALKVLATFPNATKPWVARPGLPDRVKNALRQNLIAVKDPVALAALRFDGFVEGNDEDYELIRTSISANSQFFASQ